MELDTPFSYDEVRDAETGHLILTLRYEDKQDPQKSIHIGIAPEYGSNILQLRIGDREVFRTDKQAVKDGRWTGCFVLWPLPNRVDKDGRKAYEFEGQVVDLEDIERKEGNRPLIHGLVDDQQWTHGNPVVAADSVGIETSISVDEGGLIYRHYPFRSQLTLRYTLTMSGLEVAYTVTNRDKRNLPFVFALHPYYALLGGRGGTRVRIPARSVMKATAELVPTGEVADVRGTVYNLNEPTVVKGLWFDDVWTDLEAGQHVYVEYPELGLRIKHITTDEFTHAVLYTQNESDLGFIVLEPQTGAVNAINLADTAKKQNNPDLARLAHLIVVPSGKSYQGKVKFAIEFTSFPLRAFLR